MKKLNFKNIQLLWGMLLLVLGFLIFAGVSNSFRYLGIVLLVAGVIYFIQIFNFNDKQSEDEDFKSKTRDQVYKYRSKR